MLLDEELFILFAHLHDICHVDFIVSREHSRCILSFLQAAGNRLAQARHTHTLLAWS